jgi:leader peptidase (prepilin peptidase)/N-methyltransferase
MREAASSTMTTTADPARSFTSKTAALRVPFALCLVMAGSAAVWSPPSALPASLGFGGALVLLACIDIAVLRLPDLITLPLVLAGLAAGSLVLRQPLLDRAIGAVAGYAAFALAGWRYARLRGRQGLGLGDAKLLSVAGAWLGWRALPIIVVLAAGGGLAWAGVLVLRRGRAALSEPIPFGPPLCAAIWIGWLQAVNVAG